MRDWFIERKLNGSFTGSFIRGKSFVKGLVASGYRVQPDVLFESGKVDHRTSMQFEGWNSVTDRFLRTRDVLANGAADRRQHLLRRDGKARDIVIDIFEFLPQEHELV